MTLMIVNIYYTCTRCLNSLCALSHLTWHELDEVSVRILIYTFQNYEFHKYRKEVTWLDQSNLEVVTRDSNQLWTTPKSRSVTTPNAHEMNYVQTTPGHISSYWQNPSHLKIFSFCLFVESNVFYAQLSSHVMHGCGMKRSVSLNSNQ